jgi:hypothetical protein
MTAILYTFDRAFMRKTYEAIDQYVDAESAYLALGPEASGSAATLREVTRDGRSVDETVAAIDPDVVVRNHRLRPGEFDFDTERTVVHIRHGASVGRGEIAVTTEELGDLVDVALAPGERWAARYREDFPDGVRVAVVGVPEADALVHSVPPRERRVLYAPTNHNYGSGCYLNTADSVLDVFAGSDYELLFRPHPMDRIEEPGKSVTERCRERIKSLPNVTFDDSDTPRGSLRRSDVLISDYSGIVTEWLHTDRPMVQLTDLAGDADPPQAGTMTDTVSISLVDDLYENGFPAKIREKRAEFRSSLGIPMDGRAGERVATHIQTCTE